MCESTLAQVFVEGDRSAGDSKSFGEVVALDENGGVGTLGLEGLVQIPDLRPLWSLHVGNGGTVCGLALPRCAEANVGIVPVLVWFDGAGVGNGAEVVEWCESLTARFFCALAEEACNEDRGLIEWWAAACEDEVDSLEGCQGEILDCLGDLDELVR